MPLADGLSPGQSVEVSLGNCVAGAAATLFVGGMSAQTIQFSMGNDGTCMATLAAPQDPGLFPVAVDTKKGARLWTTLSVGSAAAVIASRDRWRPMKQAWSNGGGGSGGSLIIGVLLAIGVGVVLVALGRRTPAVGGAIGGRVQVKLSEPGGSVTPLSIGVRPVRMGRDPAQVDVVLSQPTISRLHVVLCLVDADLHLTNQAGPEATLVDGSPVPTGATVVVPMGATVRLAGGVLIQR